MPVRIYETAIEALEATETASIVREWSTYEWARYCQSIAAELADSASSKQDLIEQVTARTVKLVPTIRCYLDVLSLPEEIHALLTDGPEGTPQQWAALRNHNENVRYYGDLWWSVAARLGRHQSKIAERRVIRIAAKAVEFEMIDDAAAFVDQTVNNSQRPVEEIQRRACSVDGMSGTWKFRG